MSGGDAPPNLLPQLAAPGTQIRPLACDLVDRFS